MPIGVNDLTEEINQRLGPFAPLANIPSVAAWAMREMGFITVNPRTVTDADFVPVQDDDVDELFDFVQYGAAERILDNIDPVQLKANGIDEPADDLRRVWRERVKNLHDKLQKKYSYGLPRLSTGSLQLPDTGDCRPRLASQAASPSTPSVFGFTVGFGTGSDADRLMIDGVASGPHLSVKGDKGDRGDTGATGATGSRGDTGPQGPPGPGGSGSGASLGDYPLSAYGATTDRNQDSRAAIQAAAAAAGAAVKAALLAGIPAAQAVLVVDSGPSPYYTSGPVSLLPGVCVRGGSIYCFNGPAFIVGVQSLEDQSIDPATFRPSSDSVLDASLRGWHGFAAGAGAVAVFPCHPLKVGTNPPADAPIPLGGYYGDYYAETKAITIEFCFTLPSNYSWANTDQFFGLCDLYGRPDPWIVEAPYGSTGPGPGFSFLHKDADSANNWRVDTCIIPNGTLGTYRAIIQYDTVSGTACFWVNNTANGRPVKQTTVYGWGGIGGSTDPGSGAGHKFFPTSGATPFMIGAKAGVLPNQGGAVSPATYHGFRVTRGKLYDTTGAAGSSPVFSEPSMLGQPVDDQHMYATLVNSATARTVSYIDFSAPPSSLLVTTFPLGQGTGIISNTGQAIMGDGNNSFTSSNIQSANETAILFGGMIDRGLTIDDCFLRGGLAALTSWPSGYSQPVTITRSVLNGSDAPVSTFNTFLTVRDCTSGAGREALRACGGQYVLSNWYIGTPSPNWTNGFQFLDNAYGSTADISNCGFDNEGQPPLNALVDYHMPQYPGSAYCLVRVLVASMIGAGTFVSLSGSAFNNNTAYVDISGLNDVDWAGDTASSAVRANGAGLWFGKVDLTSLPYHGIAGDGFGGIVVTHR